MKVAVLLALDLLSGALAAERAAEASARGLREEADSCSDTGLLQVARSEPALSDTLVAASHKRLKGTVENQSYTDTAMTFPQIPYDGAEKCVEGLYHINPSLLPRTDISEVWAVFRTLCMQCTDRTKMWCRTRKGRSFGSWHSQLSLARASLSGFDPGARARASLSDVGTWTHFGVTADPRLQPQPAVGMNATELQECSTKFTPAEDIAFGPEDPRLIRFAGKTYVMIVATQMVPPAPDGGRALCQEHGVIPHLAELRSPAPGKVEFGRAVQLHFADMNFNEKNWSPFSWQPPTGEEQMLMVYSIHPHRILRIEPSTGQAQLQHSEPSAPVVELFQKYGWKPERAHGGAGVVALRDPTSDEPYYLSILHHVTDWRERKGSTEYFNFPYKFSSQPPFQILAIGRPLPLKTKENPMNGAHVQFVSSVTEVNGQILIGYNAGDTESRIFQISQQELENTFFA